jgi:hypothetical protein
MNNGIRARIGTTGVRLIYNQMTPMIRDEVSKAIERRSPAYVPLAWWDKPEWSDVVLLESRSARGWKAKTTGETEWGYAFETLDPARSFGQVRHPPGTDWDKALQIQAPDVLSICRRSCGNTRNNTSSATWASPVSAP